MPQDYTPRRRPDEGSYNRRPAPRSGQRPPQSRSAQGRPAGSRPPQGRPPQRRPRKRGIPPIIPLGLIIIVLLIVLIVVSISRCAAPSEGKTSSSSGSSSSTASGDPAAPTAEPTATPVPTTPPEKDITNKNTETLGGVMVVDNAGYEYYNFQQDFAEDYIDIVNAAATSLKGKAKLVEVIIPTSLGIILPTATTDYNGISVSDQKKAMDFFYSSMNEDVTKVNIFDTMKLHHNEYIYFRTDHHWTALGAYYAYTDAVKSVGITPLALTDFDTATSYDNYLGSFYANSENNPALAATPDVVDLLKPKANISMKITDADGNETDYDSPFIDATEYPSSLKYSTFIGGDNPYTVLTNNDLTTTDSCIVVKESFGNAFAPFLAAHYKNVYVVDYRYYSGKVQELADTTGAKDVYVLNNLSATRSEDRVSDLATVF